MSQILDTLLSILRVRTTAASRDWLDHQLAQSAACTADTLLRAYTAASRKMGREPLALTASEREPVLRHDAEISLAQWTMDDAARAAMLLAIADSGNEHFGDLASACYEQGDTGEQQSWLRALPLLPGSDRFAADAIDACRTNIVPLFEAIACENPFPARHFPERNFNQLVLKALFNNIAMDRIVGLPRRLNAELSRMASDYVRERRAAARPLPPDIWTVIADTDAAALNQEITR